MPGVRSRKSLSLYNSLIAKINLSLIWKVLGTLLAGLLVFVILSSVTENPPTANPLPASIAAAQSSCAENGTLQMGNAIGKDGFTIPYQLYLPPCYAQQSPAAYPVLYLISTDETIWFETGLGELADRMIQQKQISPFIIISTRTDFSRLETLFTDVVDVLVPHVDSSFRTQADRLHRAVAGGSGSADMASCLVFRYPGLFENAGAFAGGWCFSDQELIDAFPADERPRVFMDTGDRDNGVVASMPGWASSLAENNIQFVMNIGSGNHSFQYWMSNMEMYLRWWAKSW